MNNNTINTEVTMRDPAPAGGAKRQRELAFKAVDRIRLLHRKDGEGFFEIMERETGVKLYET